jgi:hypothetical protein
MASYHRSWGILSGMEGLAVIFFPMLLMFFALSMERVETRLRRLTAEEGDVETFFEHASTADVNTFVQEGFPQASAVLRNRRRSSGRHSSQRPNSPARASHH